MKWKLTKEYANQFPYNTIGITWFVFRREVTRLQRQEGIIKNPISSVWIKFHWFTNLLTLHWSRLPNETKI